MSEFSTIINKFDSTVVENGINVISDSEGNLSMEAPCNMSDDVAKKVATKINIIDRGIIFFSQIKFYPLKSTHFLNCFLL